MKKNSLISIATLAMLAISCGTQKQATTNNYNPFGTEITVPCSEYSYDDNYNFHALGTGIGVNLQNAREMAFSSAKTMLVQRFGGKLRSVSENYTRAVSSGNAEEISQILESDMVMVVDKLVGDSKKICERFSKDAAGNFNVFIAIQVSKREVKDQIVESASSNQSTGIEKHREDFRKIFDQEFGIE